MRVLETERLVLRRFSAGDAEFIVQLLNEPSFIQNIGDKGVRSTADALRYIETGPVANYERLGFGLYLVELKETRESIGLCGLIKREGLTDIDVGFAFLPSFWSKGYAFEAASAVTAYGRDVLGIQRIVAITAPDNTLSINVLKKLGLRFAQMIKLSESEPELRLFVPQDKPRNLSGGNMSTSREVMETWFRRVWNEEDSNAIEELFIPDGHARGLGANVLIGPQGFKQFHTALCKLLSDFVITIDRSVESGEWISTVCTLRAKAQRSGAPIEFTGSVMVRIADGKLTEAYNHWDFLSLFCQLGLLPAGTFEKALGGEKVI